MTKEKAYKYFEEEFAYIMRYFYNEENKWHWTLVYKAPEDLKNAFTERYESFARLNIDKLEFIEYSNGDYYLGEVNEQGLCHGLGFYVHKDRIDNDKDNNRQNSVGYWYDGEQTDRTSVSFTSSEEDKIFFEDRSTGVLLTVRYGVQYRKAERQPLNINYKPVFLSGLIVLIVAALSFFLSYTEQFGIHSIVNFRDILDIIESYQLGTVVRYLIVFLILGIPAFMVIGWHDDIEDGIGSGQYLMVYASCLVGCLYGAMVDLSSRSSTFGFSSQDLMFAADVAITMFIPTLLAASILIGRYNQNGFASLLAIILCLIMFIYFSFAWVAFPIVVVLAIVMLIRAAYRAII